MSTIPTTWSVQLQFEAATYDDALAVMSGWTLSEGVVVVGVIGAQNMLPDGAVEVGKKKGDVVAAISQAPAETETEAEAT